MGSPFTQLSHQINLTGPGPDCHPQGMMTFHD